MNRKTVAFDLETIADHESSGMFDPLTVKLGNTKDPDKVAAKLAEAKQKHLEKMGLNKFENMICLFTYCDGDKSGHVLLEEATGEAERKLLQQVWEILDKYEHFVTFNGIDFDVPILNLHSLFRKVRPSINISTKKYSITNHFDIRAVLGNYDKFAPGKLDFYLRRCLNKQKMEGIDGSEVQHYWDCDLKDPIVKYGIDDSEKTFELYQYVREYYPGIA